MSPVPTRVVLLLLLFSSLVTAANFTQCLKDFRNDPNATGGVNYRGRPTSPAQAAGFTYKTCTARCGRDSEAFMWREFAHSWLPPWVALISQLPFGSGNHLDDFISTAISLGSPALAAYSLALTCLNTRFVYRRAQRIKHESRGAVAKALVSLQQIPLELTRNERLLALIPVTEQWAQEISGRLNRRYVWPIAIGSSITWVVIAFIFTLVDSFVDLDVSSDGGAEGHAVGTLWLWLACLVIGWIWVPTFTRGESASTTGRASRTTTNRAAKRIDQTAINVYNPAKTKISKKRAEPNPLPDPTRRRSGVSFQSFTGSQNDNTHVGVSENTTANHSTVTFSRPTTLHSTTPWNSIYRKTDRLLIDVSHELGSLNRDELRLAATFNYSRIMRYLALVDDVLRGLDKLTRADDEKAWPATTQSAGGVVFPPGALRSMFNASIFALVLQCGTTAAAVTVVVLTPTIGLGCRSLGYTLYGGVSILILFLTIISTISARISETRVGRPTTFSIKGFTASIAIALRRLFLFLAFLNVVWLIVLSSFQFSHTLNNCYCNAAVTGNGTDSYIIISFEGWISTIRAGRVSATVIAAASMAIYMVFLWFMSALPTGLEYS